MSKKQKYDNDIFQTIIIGIGRMLWWLISLPFKGFKFGKINNNLSIEEKNYISSRRLEIEKSLSTENQIELKNAVIEADKLVDHTMKIQGYAGQTFAERLKKAQVNLSQSLNNEIWQGHKIRNQIAHEQGIAISNSDLKSAATKLLSYTKTL
jgi:hypothetical protein